jgi:hypothetical protein
VRFVIGLFDFPGQPVYELLLTQDDALYVPLAVFPAFIPGKVGKYGYPDVKKCVLILCALRALFGNLSFLFPAIRFSR